MTEHELVGRELEAAALQQFVEVSRRNGAALLLSGEAGVGKSALLQRATTIAIAASVRVLHVAGIEFEADVTFSGLNALLLPLRDEMKRLPDEFRMALDVALGLREADPRDRLVLGNATLELLDRAGAAAPLLVVIDDVHWLDRASALALLFVARRACQIRIGFLASVRPGSMSVFERAGFPELEVEPLNQVDASRLLQLHFPNLENRARARILVEAQGVPLALLELPRALSSQESATSFDPLPSVLPLTRRLEAVFATQLVDLPRSTRLLLLIAVLDGTGDVDVVRAAASAAGVHDDLSVTACHGLVDVHGHRVQFRHPLIRSAIVASSSPDEQRRVHAALARVLADDPERWAWHMAAAANTPNKEIARALEDSATPILRRGNTLGAVAALTRAAELTPESAARSSRLGKAAYIATNNAGDVRNLPKLLEEAQRADPHFRNSLQSVGLSALLLLNGDGDIDTAHRMLVGAIEAKVAEADVDLPLVIDALYTLIALCLYGGRAELWPPFEAVIDRLGTDAPIELHLLYAFVADPVRLASRAMGALTDAIATLHDERDPWLVSKVATCALVVDRATECRDALWRLTRLGREGEALTQAINALNVLSRDDLASGRWNEAVALASEELQICGNHGYYFLRWFALEVLALVAAMRGEPDRCNELSDDIARWALPRRAEFALRAANRALGLAALGGADFESAYRYFAAVCPPGSVGGYNAAAPLVTLDLVEAAVRAGRRTEAMAHVDAVQRADLAVLSPRLQLLALTATALVKRDSDAPAAFEAALAVDGAARWPFENARAHLLYGEQRRRAHATSEAREHLAEAHRVFERLGAKPWLERAASELRAAGVASHAPKPHSRLTLSTQELEIARLAAAGLTNKEIGARLFLSHRTVSTHLYRAFPKLGISSRAALRDALDALE